MNDKYTDKQLAKKFGRRPRGTPIDQPQEIGYRCPKGHSYLTWSEFEKHIWCYKCKKDYHYAIDCLMLIDKHNPKLPKGLQPQFVTGIENWTKDGNGFNNIPLSKLSIRKSK